MVLIGATTLPYLKSFLNDSSRIGHDDVTIGNPNDLGAWFGFCCVYCAIVGLETRRNWLRVAAWSVGLGCLLVVGLTVSRAPLAAVACSLALAFRRLLRRGFYPFVALAATAWIAYGLGVFDQSAEMYARRGLEESGRLLVWPLAIDRFLQTPWTGAGANHVTIALPDDGVSVTPHNGLIFIALASGIVPLLFLVAYWVQSFAAVWKVDARAGSDVSFHMPLLLYACLIVLNLNEAFMLPWVMVTLASVTADAFLSKARRSVLRQRVRFRIQAIRASAGA
jgi:O-antigen ligase